MIYNSPLHLVCNVSFKFIFLLSCTFFLVETQYYVTFTHCSTAIYVVISFLSQVIFIFPLSLGMVMYANEFETKEKQKLSEIKMKFTARYISVIS